MKNGMDFLREHSIFWSRLGFENDPARYGADGKLIEFGGDYAKFSRYHRDMADAGIKLHTGILFSGWVGPDKYDYTLTDRTLDALFEAVPDALYLPRVKLNAPVEWSKVHPEELFVYYGGNDDPEFIRPRVGSPDHDLLGYEAPNGYYMGRDRRPNVNGFFSNQSFASEVWRRDAAKALASLMRHIAAKPYGQRVIGWHIAYGVSGETCQWGRFGRTYGDYSRVFRRAFRAWGERRYGSRENLLKAWGTLEMPSPDERRNVLSSVSGFLRCGDSGVRAADLDRFMSELNASNAEFFCRAVKEENPEMLTGIFYGYILECSNANYTGWLDFDRVLRSPWIDFMAAPTSYYRRGEGESGGFIVPALSVNRRKFWVDELDIRTSLCSNPGEVFIPESCTRAVFFRELAKNLAANAGFWWMDLGGGWYDSEKMHGIIREVEATARTVRAKGPGISAADVLIVVDENAGIRHTESGELFNLHLDFTREIGISGVLFDILRLADLPETDLSQYKLIVFRDCPNPLPECVKTFSGAKLFSYLDDSPGVRLTESSEPFPPGKISFLGVPSGEIEFKGSPLPRVVPDSAEEVLAVFQDGTPAVTRSGNSYYSVLPLMRWKQFRELAAHCGCRIYGKSACTVYGDSRFLAVFSHDEPEDFSFVLR